MRPIDADELKKHAVEKYQANGVELEPIMMVPLSVINNAQTVESKCKTCKYYHPYLKQFSNEPRGDGYCVIARMTPEGMTTINCNDEFGCLDYQKGGAE